MLIVALLDKDSKTKCVVVHTLGVLMNEYTYVCMENYDVIYHTLAPSEV